VKANWALANTAASRPPSDQDIDKTRHSLCGAGLAWQMGRRYRSAVVTHCVIA
jgi:hypothetical protein